MRKPIVVVGLAVLASVSALGTEGALAASSTTSMRNTVSTSQGSTQTGSSTASSGTFTLNNSVSPGAIIQTALKYIGYEYTTVGNSPSTGFSCIGFVSYVYNVNGIPLPDDLQGAWNYAPKVPFSDLQPGDILYFKNTVWTGLSHVAIYLGGGKFIHSEYYGVGVRISSFYNDPKDYNYWTQKYMGANRPWGGTPVAPAVVSTSPATVAAPSVTVANSGKVGSTATISVAVNVRTSPSVTSSKQTVLSAGTQVTVLGKSNGWYKVQLPNGTVGWIIADGLGLGSSATATPSATPTATSTSTANGTNGLAVTVGTPTAPARQGQVPATVTGVSVTVHVSTLRVHSGPSLKASTVNTAGKGQHLKVIKRKGSWVEVQLPDGTVGWVSAAYVASAHGASPVGTSVSKTGVTAKHVLTAAVRVHIGPNITSSVILTAAHGTHVAVLSYTNGWARVRLPSGVTGYVLGTYVR